ncbi:MAG TPA: universal stress protein [Candidatus Hydrogenedentes bacterium]|nr:universal stress protein [Candidatus Hydrogenedentota bacterium]
MIKRVLVPVDGSDEANIGAHYAVSLAKRCGATLLGLHVVDIKLLEGPLLRDISASLGTAPYVNYQGNIAMILEERGKAALKAFEDACKDAGVPSKTEQVTGIVTRAILEKGELADLIVMGRSGEHGPWLEGLVGSTTEAVVRRARQPVLITAVAAFKGSRFVVAYDGSHHANKAVQTAATLAAEWRMDCHVLAVGGKKVAALLEEAKAYLQAHAVAAQYVTREGDPSEAIVAYAAECQADLLIMGAYGHTKVRELVVGSTTAYAVNHAPCPVLLTR